MKKKLLVVLGLFLLSLFCTPLNSQAYTLPYEDIDMPAVSGLYIRVLDRNGEAFPIPLEMEADELRSSYPPAGVTTPARAIENKDPVVFTTANNSNIFYFDRKGYEYRTLRARGYQQGFANWTITTELPYIKYFSSEPPEGTQKVVDLHPHVAQNDVFSFIATPTTSWSNTSHVFGNWRTTNNMTVQAKFEEQSDGTFLQTQGTYALIPNATIIVSSLGYTHLVVNENAIGSKASADYYGIDGEGITVYAHHKAIQEIFEDENGTRITAPDGYTDGKWTEVTSDPFTFVMEDGEKLPNSYTIGTQLYLYQGWYKGAGNKSSMNTAYPPAITFDAAFDESQDEVHIVYKKAASVTLTEKYMTESGSQIEADWDRTITVEKGVAYTQQPEAAKTDSSGKCWVYAGWKLASDPVGTKRTTPVSVATSSNTEVHYIYELKRYGITEKWVDAADGDTLLGVTPNPDLSQRADETGSYSSTPPNTMTDDAGFSWTYVGWENVTDSPGIVYPAVEPVSLTSIQEDTELKYHYARATTSATLTIFPDNEIVNNAADVVWSVRLTNTGTSDLKNIMLKKTDSWAQGLDAPEEIIVSTYSGIPKTIPVTPADWETGIALTDVVVPSGGGNQSVADIVIRNTKAAGRHNQVLPAAIEVTGNLTASVTGQSFVRIDDPDQLNLQQTGETALINLPNFKFGTVGILPRGQTKSLEADEYLREDYYPYIRFMDQSISGSWSLSLQLGAFSDGVEMLPQTTSISLKQGRLNEVTDFNKATEALNRIAVVNDKTLFSNDTSVLLLAGSDKGIYQIDYDLTDVELHLPNTTEAVLGKSYEAELIWALTIEP